MMYIYLVSNQGILAGLGSSVLLPNFKLHCSSCCKWYGYIIDTIDKELIIISVYTFTTLDDYKTCC